MKAEVAQLRQEHHPPLRTFAGQAFQPIQHVLFKRRTQRIIRIMERCGGKPVAPHANGGQLLQFVEIERAIKTP